jgi:hypothetical protein
MPLTGLAEYFISARPRQDRIENFPAGSGRIAAATSATGRFGVLIYPKRKNLERPDGGLRGIAVFPSSPQ